MHLLISQQITPTPLPLIEVPSNSNSSNRISGTPATPPPTSGDSIFWTIIALSILATALQGHTGGYSRILDALQKKQKNTDQD
jgi:hypothetical protein